MTKPENLLMLADSERDADMLYAVGLFVPDPFIFLRARQKNYIVMSDLEIDRAKRWANDCKVLPLSRYLKRLERAKVDASNHARVIQLVLKQLGIRKVTVPRQFSVGIARELEALKIRVSVKPDPCFPERAVKSPQEVKKISAALMMAEVGLSEGIQALKCAKIGKGGRLIYHGVPLIAEKLRSIIDAAVVQAGGVASHTIVAGGRQGCDPHEQGHGILKANEPIIIDIFPRSQKTGYYGDITRTVVRGRASEAVRKLYDTVRRAQEIAMASMKGGVPGASVHQSVQDFFVSQGYKTRQIRGRMQGFFHGTGHGLGLEIHEPPRTSPRSKDVLQSGNVVTVEPGLYYPQVGGVRLEDVVLVTSNAPRNLTAFEKSLEV